MAVIPSQFPTTMKNNFERLNWCIEYYLVGSFVLTIFSPLTAEANESTERVGQSFLCVNRGKRRSVSETEFIELIDGYI